MRFVTLTSEEISGQFIFLLLFSVVGLSLTEGGERCERSSSSNEIIAEWPMIRMGSKSYYIGHFFKISDQWTLCSSTKKRSDESVWANWYKANEFCRFHAMQLVSVESQAENNLLEKTVQEFGLGHEHFWTSGTDQGEEGVFTWFGNGRPLTFTNWNTGEPNNFRYENGEEEHCLELWNRDGKGLRWNDTPCSFQTYFVCER